MHILICGNTGSGKSVLSQKIIDGALRRDENGKVLAGEVIYSTVPLNGHDAPVTVVATTREEAKERGIPFMFDVSCGVLFIDELHKYLPARGFDRLPQGTMNFWTTHRHRDLTIVSNTQHPSFIDKVARIITDKVLLCQLSVLPVIGWIWPKTVRPPHKCVYGEHPRRDAMGDRADKWGRLLGRGAMIVWDEYPPSVLNDTESLDMSYVAELGIKRRGSGRLLFDIEWAKRGALTVQAEVFSKKGKATPVVVDRQMKL